jgi:DNA invertase Pin-like site-specific DNA recombinase
MSDLLGLAERFVRLSAELEEVRAEMRAALTNGAEETRPFSPAARQKLGGKEAQEAEQSILRLLEKEPGLGTAAIARAMDARVDTTTSRLKRLRTRGEIVGGGKDGWRVTA